MSHAVKVAAIILIVGVVGVAAAGACNLARNYLARDATPPPANCVGRHGVTHTVRIVNGAVTPATTEAHRCDVLTIVNADPVTRLLAFGVHSHHVAYGQTTEKTVGQNDSLTVTLSTPGTFLFHDHLHDEVQGHFIVTE